MSIRIMTAVWDSQIQERGKLLVLLCLADHANDEGICHPSVRRLARRTRLTERHVYNLLSELESEGIVSRISRPGTSTLYRIHVDRLAQLPAEHPPTPEAQFTPEISSPLKSVHPTPEAQFTPPLKPSSGEPSINHKENLPTTNVNTACARTLEAGASGHTPAHAHTGEDDDDDPISELRHFFPGASLTLYQQDQLRAFVSGMDEAGRARWRRLLHERALNGGSPRRHLAYWMKDFTKPQHDDGPAQPKRSRSQGVHADRATLGRAYYEETLKRALELLNEQGGDGAADHGPAGLLPGTSR